MWTTYISSLSHRIRFDNLFSIRKFDSFILPTRPILASVSTLKFPSLFQWSKSDLSLNGSRNVGTVYDVGVTGDDQMKMKNMVEARSIKQLAVLTTTTNPLPHEQETSNENKPSSTITPSNFADSRKQQSILKPKYRPPKLPVVLCHGLFGYDRLGPDAIPLLQVRYWGGIYEALSEIGAKVYVARVPATGNIEERAYQLNKFLTEKLAGEDVNLICHSMGGLDARFLISHVNSSEYTVRSLTTISTPHRGSPVMDWFRDNIGVGKEQLKAVDRDSTYMIRLLNNLISVLDAPAYNNLTTDFMTQKFNPSTPDSKNLQYFSYGASAKSLTHPLSPLRLTYDVVKEREGENDGIVSVYSARWGEFMGVVEADHFELTRKKRMITNHLPNFPLMNFIRLQHLWTLASTVQPLLKNLPLPLVLKDGDVTKKSPSEAYRKRIKSVLNKMHGPQSIDDFIYGYDHEYLIGKGTQTKIPRSKFDVHEFYLSVADKLARSNL